MIKYLGSKRLLANRIAAIAAAVPGARSVVDLFSGTSRVGQAFKHAGLQVHSNDYASYAHALAQCYIVADAEEWIDPATALLAELARTMPAPGYFTRTFCEEARYFTPENGALVDAIREEIARRQLPPTLEAIALVALMEAADRVDSTTGVQMAYLKAWAPRALQPLQLRVPALIARASAGAGSALQLDAVTAAARLTGDVGYLDPPYNQHSYLGNYHVWETLVRWDAPHAYGIARKRVDTRIRPSEFNSRPRHSGAMRQIIDTLDTRVLVVSFSDEGYLTREQLVEMLAARGEVLVLSHDHKRYVGAQIGIFNPKGKKVGAVSHLRNTEHIFVAGPAADIAAVAAAVAVPGQYGAVAATVPCDSARPCPVVP